MKGFCEPKAHKVIKMVLAHEAAAIEAYITTERFALYISTLKAKQMTKGFFEN